MLCTLTVLFELPAYGTALLVHSLEIEEGGGGLNTDAAEGAGITVYTSVLRLVCIQCMTCMLQPQ